MTDEARARRIHAVYVDWAKARSKPWTAWEDLPIEKRERLIAAAHRLQSEYAAAGDAPSYGGFR